MNFNHFIREEIKTLNLDSQVSHRIVMVPGFPGFLER